MYVSLLLLFYCLAIFKVKTDPNIVSTDYNGCNGLHGTRQKRCFGIFAAGGGAGAAPVAYAAPAYPTAPVYVAPYPYYAPVASTGSFGPVGSVGSVGGPVGSFAPVSSAGGFGPVGLVAPVGFSSGPVSAVASAPAPFAQSFSGPFSAPSAQPFIAPSVPSAQPIPPFPPANTLPANIVPPVEVSPNTGPLTAQETVGIIDDDFLVEQKQTYPLKECYTNDELFMCCNNTLEDYMEEAFNDMLDEQNDDYNLCNTHKIAQYIGDRLEQRFGKRFETIVANNDFVSKSHFYRNQYCKIRRNGKVILAYGTPDEFEVAEEEIEATTNGGAYATSGNPNGYENQKSGYNTGYDNQNGGFGSTGGNGGYDNQNSRYGNQNTGYGNNGYENQNSGNGGSYEDNKSGHDNDRSVIVGYGEASNTAPNPSISSTLHSSETGAVPPKITVTSTIRGQESHESHDNSGRLEVSDSNNGKIKEPKGPSSSLSTSKLITSTISDDEFDQPLGTTLSTPFKRRRLNHFERKDGSVEYNWKPKLTSITFSKKDRRRIRRRHRNISLVGN